MKNTIIIFLLFLLISSCSNNINFSLSGMEYSPPTEFLYEAPEFQDLTEIIKWIEENISYKAEINQNPVVLDWQPPHKTYELGNGDCEDVVIIAMYFIRQYTLLKPNLIIVENSKGGYHAILEIDLELWITFKSTTFDDKNYAYYIEASEEKVLKRLTWEDILQLNILYWNFKL